MPGAEDWRLHRHADYQRVYNASRKQFSPLMTYFVAPRTAGPETGVRPGPRIGLTTGRVLGKAVERNRIKRRMRAAVCASLPMLLGNVDVILHPRRTVLTVEFAELLGEVQRIFRNIERAQHTPAASASGKRRLA